VPQIRLPIVRSALLALASCLLLAAPAIAHDIPDGRAPLLGPPAPLDSGPGTVAANDRLASAIDEATAKQAQADFTDQLLGAPPEVAGSCDQTEHFTGIGDGCLTTDGLLRVALPGGGSTTTHGPDFLGADGDADPATLPPDMVAAIRGASASDVACVAPTERHVHLVYAIPADGIDRSAAQASSFRQALYEMSAVINAESRSVDPTAGRKVRVDCTGNTPNIDVYRLPTRSTADSFATVKTDLAARTHESSLEGRTHYLVFYDEQLDDQFAGIADMYPDDRAGTDNDNDMGGLVAVQDGGDGVGPSWEVMLHEASHNMGAVAHAAPGSNHVGHCNDGLDVMCYAEPATPGVSGTYSATTCALKRYDCAKDTYFNPSPVPTDWLATHWNVAASANGFLDQTTATNDTTAPGAPASLTGLGHGTFVRLSWPASTDDVGVAAYRAYVRTTPGSGPWVPVQDAQPGDLTLDVFASTATGIGLSPNTSYEFGVSAYDQRGNESTRAVATVNTGGFTGEDPTISGAAPPPPLDVVVTGRAASSLTFAWKHGTGGGDYAIEAYRFSSGAWQPVLWTTDTTGVSVGGLAASTETTIRFRTRSHDGQVSTPVDVTASTSTPADTTPPAAPGSVTATGTGIAPTLSWTSVPDAAHYLVYRDGTLAESVTSTSTVVRGIAYATNPTLAVTAVDAAGNESAAATTTFAAGSQPDSQAPTAPSGISFVPTVTTLTLNWSSPGTDNVGIVGYRILTAVPASRDFVLRATVGGTATSATATGLDPGTLYQVRVQSVDAAGYVSNPLSYYELSTSPDALPPTQPAAAATSHVTATSIDLTWGASIDNVAVAGYRVYRGATLVATLPPTSTTYTFLGLADATSYVFHVTAIDATGNESSMATASAATLDGTPPAVVWTLSVALDSTSGGVSVTWPAPSDNVGVIGYHVTLDGFAQPDVSGARVDLAGLVRGSAHSITVTAFDAAGNTGGPATTTFTVPEAPTQPTPPTQPTRTAPAAPSNLQILTTTTALTASWTASADATTYHITLQPGTGQPLVADVTGTSTTFAKLPPRTSFTISIAGANDIGVGAATSTAASTLADTALPTTPGKPRAISPKAGQLKVTWTTAADNVKVARYELKATTAGRKPVVVKLGAAIRATTLKKLKPRAAYVLQIRAVDGAGNASRWVSFRARTR
jgi:hypothetical protein